MPDPSPTETRELADAMAALDDETDPLSEETRERVREVANRHFGPPPEGIDEAILDEGSVVGTYRVEHLIGSGGQAVVHRARHLHLPDRRVAVKVPLGPSAKRMSREARVLDDLDHPNVVDLVDYWPDPPTILLEHCAGGSLADRLAADGPLPEAEVLRIGRAVLRALDHAHGRGVVHRDLKPENVLFDGDDTPKVADFGIGKVVAERLSLSLSRASGTGVVGTPVYLAPEQERPGAEVDGRTDLYAFGKLLHAMLTGDPPRTLRPVSRERDDVDEAWTEIVFRLTETDPADRFPDAASVLEALDGIDGGAKARPDRTGEEVGTPGATGRGTEHEASGEGIALPTSLPAWIGAALVGGGALQLMGPESQLQSAFGTLALAIGLATMVLARWRSSDRLPSSTAVAWSLGLVLGAGAIVCGLGDADPLFWSFGTLGGVLLAWGAQELPDRPPATRSTVALAILASLLLAWGAHDLLTADRYWNSHLDRGLALVGLGVGLFLCAARQWHLADRIPAGATLAWATAGSLLAVGLVAPSAGAPWHEPGAFGFFAGLAGLAGAVLYRWPPLRALRAAWNGMT